jgi:hypothetical protein
MVGDRFGRLHGNVSLHGDGTLALGNSLAIAGTSRSSLLLKNYPLLIPSLLAERRFGVRLVLENVHWDGFDFAGRCRGIFVPN